jgi:hypothetical protein
VEVEVALELMKADLYTKSQQRTMMLTNNIEVMAAAVILLCTMTPITKIIVGQMLLNISIEQRFLYE